MGFQLTISEGKEVGREFVFEQASVTIGRNSDCEVVLYDAGISRRHARIFTQGGAVLVEDLGSSNGTSVNGAPVSGPTELQDGDNIALGPVVFSYSSTELPPAEGGGAEGGASTRIVSMDEIRRQRNRGSALAPTGANTAQLQELERAATSMHRAVPKAGGRAAPAQAGGAAGAGGRAGPPARQGGAAAGRAGPPARAGRPAQGGGLSAAERARLKREASGFTLFWAEASPAKRKALGAVGVVLLCALLGGVYWATMGGGGGPVQAREEEPDRLGRQPIPKSFGLGEGVDFARADGKTFSFDVSSPGEVVVLIHYQAGDIQDREVSISVNGVELGFVPADKLGSDMFNNEVVVPVKVVKRNETNTVIFDNVKNPPGQDPWRVYNLWVEVVGIPQGTPEELMQRAQESFKRGNLAMDGKEIGAVNRYRAWREYRTAWLSLEGLADKPDLYAFARDKVKEAQRELDTKCNTLMLSIRNYEIDPASKDWERVKEELRYARNFFPEKDQPCFWKIRGKMDDLGME